jgi:type VI secretion system protein ImpA
MRPFDSLSLPDLSEVAPAGENLELDPDFGALERAVRGKPETQYGSTVDPAKPPEWQEAELLALRLLERTRDLRVLSHLAVARLHLHGLAAFADALGQIRQQLTGRWEQVHPWLDPEDNLDPMQRRNALIQLQDPAKVLRALRDFPLATPPRARPVSWRDIAIFNGTIEHESGHEKPSEVMLRDAFAKTDPERMQQLFDGLDRAVAEAEAIPAAFEARAGAGSGPDLSDLAKLLRELQRDVRRFAALATPTTPDVPGETAQPDVTAGPDPAPTTVAAAPRGTMNIRSITAVYDRDDALYLLDLASAYFRANEPSSPLPLLIERARRLASMDFLEVLRDVAPDGLVQAQMVAGRSAG